MYQIETDKREDAMTKGALWVVIGIVVGCLGMLVYCNSGESDVSLEPRVAALELNQKKTLLIIKRIHPDRIKIEDANE